MKKTIMFAIILCLGVVFNCMAQDKPSTDVYIGNWEMLFIGTPNGDAVMKLTLARKDGKFEGTIVPVNGESKEEIKLSSVEEGDGKITIYFTIQGYDVNVGLEKVDDDNLKGSLMGMFDAKAKRIKQ